MLYMIYKDINSKQHLKYIYMYFIASYSLTSLCNDENWTCFTIFSFLSTANHSHWRGPCWTGRQLWPARFLKPNSQGHVKSHVNTAWDYQQLALQRYFKSKESGKRRVFLTGDVLSVLKNSLTVLLNSGFPVLGGNIKRCVLGKRVRGRKLL